VARKSIRSRRTFLILMAIGIGAPVLGRLVWSSSHSMWSGYGAVLVFPATVVAAAAVAGRVRIVRRSGETVRGVLVGRRQRAQALVDSADKLNALAPAAAGLVALVSFPAVFLALVAAPSTGGVHLPAAADARLQLWCLTAGVLITIVALDCWYGPGISVRALATDGFTAAAVTFTVALVATSPVMIFHDVESRAAWLAIAVAQFVWPFSGVFLCGAVSAGRKRKLFRFAETAPDPSATWPRGTWDRRSLRPDAPVAGLPEDSGHRGGPQGDGNGTERGQGPRRRRPRAGPAARLRRPGGPRGESA